MAAIAGAGVTAHAILPDTVEAASGFRSIAFSPQQGDPTTLTIEMDGSPSDLDPHSAYDSCSVPDIVGAIEGLLGHKDDKTDEFVGLIAKSWTPNEDMNTRIFTLRDGVTFQDGTSCDANTLLLNYERLFTLGLGAVGVLSRFNSDWQTQITAPNA